eukprot:2281801-Rhodomonas_salina.4
MGQARGGGGKPHLTLRVSVQQLHGPVSPIIRRTRPLHRLRACPLDTALPWHGVCMSRRV